MRTEDSRTFTDFVSAEQAGLLRLAILLAGDHGHAEDLVQIALMKTYRHWARISRSAPPSAYVRRVLVTTHTSWRRRLSTTEQVMETLPERADPTAVPDEEDEDLRRALRALPPRMRTAVVLRYFEDLSEQGAADLMGCSASTVNTQTARGLARLRTSLSAPDRAPPHPGGPVVMEETELRARLERLAERTVPPVQHPGELTAAVVSRHHAARRRQRALLTVAALVAAVFVSVPTWLSQRSADPGPAGPASSSGVYTVPTRGNLADEVDFLEAMRRRPWTTDLPGSDVQEPPLDTRRVVYAGASSVAWWVLVAGADPAAALRPDEGVDPADLDELGSVAIAWFTGPRNAGARGDARLWRAPHRRRRRAHRRAVADQALPGTHGQLLRPRRRTRRPDPGAWSPVDRGRRRDQRRLQPASRAGRSHGRRGSAGRRLHRPGGALPGPARRQRILRPAGDRAGAGLRPDRRRTRPAAHRNPRPPRATRRCLWRSTGSSPTSACGTTSSTSRCCGPGTYRPRTAPTRG